MKKYKGVVYGQASVHFEIEAESEHLAEQAAYQLLYDKLKEVDDIKCENCRIYNDE